MFEPKVKIHYQYRNRERNGRGFSRKELIEAGLTVDEALWMGIPLDPKRKTLYEDNVETIFSIIDHIKTLHEELEEQRKLEIARQEERKAEKEKDSKKKKKGKEAKKEEKKAPKKEEKPAVVEAAKEEPEEGDKESMPLDDIPGVGPKTADRLFDAGYVSVADIANAKAEDLAQVKGISEKSAAELIKKAKEL
ncbi:MAG: ribosomal protein L13e [Candidatus Methanofastidiosa archaeon]|nr:ribosomal protein L13e [Candidatus Methanofastidiosa archaeon]